MAFFNTVNRSNALNPSSVSSTPARPVQGFALAFFQSPSLETPDDQDLETQGDQRISYAHGTVSEFENDEKKFKLFKKEFISQLDFLIEFTQVNGGDVETVRKGFKTLQRRLFNPRDHYYDKRKGILYGTGKRGLDALSGLLHNEALSLTYRLDTVVKLAIDVVECSDGAASNLAIAANDLNLRLGGNEIYRLKEQVSRQLMFEYIQRNFPRMSRQWEIHYCNAFHNALANRLGLPTYEDGYENACKVTPEKIEDCLSHILEHLTPARLACAMADECLSQLDTTMQDHFAKLQNGDTSASFSYMTSKDALDDAMIPIMERCGGIGIAGFIRTVDGKDARCGINKDATLIALEILKILYERKLTKDYLPKKLFGYTREDGIKIAIEHHDTQLIWATEDDAPVLLTVEYLKKMECLLQPKSLPHKLDEDIAKLAVTAAITNSSSAEMSKSLSTAWLEKADTIQWAAKMDGETCFQFLEKHETVIKKLPRDERFHVVRGIVDCGSVSAFKAYIADNQDLFDTSEKALVTLVRFGIVAAKNKDMGMLDAVVNLMLEKIEQSSSVSGSVLAMMERSLRLNVENTSEDSNDVHIILSFHLGNILTKLCEKGYIKPFHLAELFACKGVEQRTALYLAMDSGRSEQVSSFGKVWLNAADKGVLSSEQLFNLLQATHEGRSAFSLAMQNQNAATVTAFARILVSAYNKGFLDAKQVAALVAHKEDNPRRRAFDSDIIKAYTQISQVIDGHQSMLDAVVTRREWGANIIHNRFLNT